MSDGEENVFGDLASMLGDEGSAEEESQPELEQLEDDMAELAASFASSSDGGADAVSNPMTAMDDASDDEDGHGNLLEASRSGSDNEAISTGRESEEEEDAGRGANFMTALRGDTGSDDEDRGGGTESAQPEPEQEADGGRATSASSDVDRSDSPSESAEAQEIADADEERAAESFVRVIHENVGSEHSGSAAGGVESAGEEDSSAVAGSAAAQSAEKEEVAGLTTRLTATAATRGVEKEPATQPRQQEDQIADERRDVSGSLGLDARAGSEGVTEGWFRKGLKKLTTKEPGATEQEGTTGSFSSSADTPNRIGLNSHTNGDAVDEVSIQSEANIAMMRAARLGDLRLARRAYAAGAQLGCLDADGWTPLVRACDSGQLAMTKYLLLEGADPNQVCGAVSHILKGAGPLFYAALGGHADVVEALIRGGAAVDAPKADGVTPLWAAAYSGCEKVVKVLLEKRADPALKFSGMTPLEWVNVNGKPEVAELLRKYDNSSTGRHGGSAAPGSPRDHLENLSLLPSVVAGGAARSTDDEIISTQQQVEQHPGGTSARVPSSTADLENKKKNTTASSKRLEKGAPRRRWDEIPRMRRKASPTKQRAPSQSRQKRGAADESELRTNQVGSSIAELQSKITTLLDEEIEAQLAWAAGPSDSAGTSPAANRHKSAAAEERTGKTTRSIAELNAMRDQMTALLQQELEAQLAWAAGSSSANARTSPAADRRSPNRSSRRSSTPSASPMRQRRAASPAGTRKQPQPTPTQTATGTPTYENYGERRGHAPSWGPRPPVAAAPVTR